MNLEERVDLTRAMTASGAMLDWSDADLPGPIVDKHSTGGVGDNVSLMLAPMLAACGAYVPMISGRGLGHTGGTLDKLDSIPGYVSQPESRCSAASSPRSAAPSSARPPISRPADRRLYAIRDVTATVESIALITASILSKKLAAGLQALVMDVKTGSGAFMPTLDAARELASSIVSVANGAGLPTAALITDMNEPLASAAGNAVEVLNAVDYLTGARRDPRLHAVTLALGAELLTLARPRGRPAAGARRAGARARQRRGGGTVRAHGRSRSAARPVSSPRRAICCPPRRRSSPAAPERAGFVTAIDVRAVGIAVVELGGGRARASDAIDPAVGFTELAGARRRSVRRCAAGAGSCARRGARACRRRAPARGLSDRRCAACASRSRSSRGSAKARREHSAWRRPAGTRRPGCAASTALLPDYSDRNAGNARPTAPPSATRSAGGPPRGALAELPNLGRSSRSAPASIICSSDP